MPARTAQEIIDQAISENRFGERLLYGLAIVFVAVGVVAIISGIWLREGVVSIAGSISSVLFWPAMREARQIRKACEYGAAEQMHRKALALHQRLSSKPEILSDYGNLYAICLISGDLVRADEWSRLARAMEQQMTTEVAPSPSATQARIN